MEEESTEDSANYRRSMGTTLMCPAHPPRRWSASAIRYGMGRQAHFCYLFRWLAEHIQEVPRLQVAFQVEAQKAMHHRI